MTYERLRYPREVEEPQHVEVSSAKAIAYIRVSTEEQDLGPEAQIASITKWAEHNHIRVVSWHEDRLSGSDPTRPGLHAAVAAAKVHEADWFVVYRRDRVARDTNLYYAIEHQLSRIGTRVITTTEDPEKPQTPQDLLMQQVITAFAQYEVAVIRERTKMALAALKARGVKLGRPPRKETDPLIIRIRELMAEGKGSRSIAKILNEEGFRTKGKNKWHWEAVGRILRSLRRKQA